MKNVSINNDGGETGYAGNSFKVFSVFGVELCMSSQRYSSEGGFNNYVFSYSLFFKINKDGVPLHRRKIRGFKIVRKGRHVWGGTFSRTQTFKRIAE